MLTAGGNYTIYLGKYVTVTDSANIFVFVEKRGTQRKLLIPATSQIYKNKLGCQFVQRLLRNDIISAPQKNHIVETIKAEATPAAAFSFMFSN